MDADQAILVLSKVVESVLKLAGGEVGSEIIDINKARFDGWPLEMNLNRLEKVLGVKIADREVLAILTRLNLSPKKKREMVSCLVPTYRADLRIEEDLFEEVARIWGYNKFPKTLPTGEVLKQKIPYGYDISEEFKLKQLIRAAGFFEVANLSLVSEEMLKKVNMILTKHLRISNPVSKDYELVRSSLIPGLLEALKLNEESEVKLFEMAKVNYRGVTGKIEEKYLLAGVFRGDFTEVRGMIDLTLSHYGIKEAEASEIKKDREYWHQTKSAEIGTVKESWGRFGEMAGQVLKSIGIEGRVVAWELNLSKLVKQVRPLIYQPLAKYPAQIEEMTFTLPDRVGVESVLKMIKSVSSLIEPVEMSKVFEKNYTFTIRYRHRERTLTDEEVGKIRKKIAEKTLRSCGAVLVGKI